MSDNATCEVCFCFAVTLMINLRSILCKVNAYSNKLCVLLEPHSSFRFQYRLLTMTTFSEIAACLHACSDDQLLFSDEETCFVKQCTKLPHSVVSDKHVPSPVYTAQTNPGRTRVKTNPGCVYTTLFQTNPGRTRVSSVYTTN